MSKLRKVSTVLAAVAGTVVVVVATFSMTMASAAPVVAMPDGTFTLVCTVKNDQVQGCTNPGFVAPTTAPPTTVPPTTTPPPTTVPPTTVPPTTVPPTTAPPTTPPPSGCFGGFPCAATTGPVPGACALPMTKNQSAWTNYTTANQVIECTEFTNGVQLSANGIIFRNNIVHCQTTTDWCLSTGAGKVGIRIEHVDVGPNSFRSVGGILARDPGAANRTNPGTNTIRWANVHHVMSGLVPDAGVTMTDSYLHNFQTPGPSAHSGGVHGNTAIGYVKLDHNRIEGGSSANIYVEHDDHYVISNNYLPGVSWPEAGAPEGHAEPTWGIRALSDSTDIVVFNNLFSNPRLPSGFRAYSLGPVSPECDFTAATFYNNKTEAGTLIPVP